MSAPSESATSPSPCACTNISLMQLFHELKQKFPGVPDHVVSNTIDLYCHDKQACETHLHREVKASLTHAYHASSSAAARQLNEIKINPPSKCRNQPIVKHEAAKSTAVESVTCQLPQAAILSTTNESEIKTKTDANQNVVELSNENSEYCNDNASPVTVVNIDNCVETLNTETPSDLELINENTNTEKVSPILESCTNELEHLSLKSTNYGIFKSNKIKYNLHEELEKGKEKKTIKKKTQPTVLEPPQEKPKRPNTLDFIKPNPDIAFKPSSREPVAECSVSPAPSAQKNESTEAKSSPYKPERGYPVNLSVNVNCHMDYSRGYGDPWVEDYDSPRAITSVNLTVCTPTSNMASPVRDAREDDGFEGHVTVTVSPSTARAPRRPAPPPPKPTRLDSPRPTRVAPEPPGSAYDRSLIERQKERLGRLAKALAQEKGRRAQLTREMQILEGPVPSASATNRLREYVKNLRDACDSMTKHLEISGRHEPADPEAFYRGVYPDRTPPSWQCHVCTFRNHPLLDKCEQCEMPRIYVGTSPSTTHDSGFGSFRDRNRRSGSQRSRTEVEPMNVVESRTELNC